MSKNYVQKKKTATKKPKLNVSLLIWLTALLIHSNKQQLSKFLNFADTVENVFTCVEFCKQQ